MTIDLVLVGCGNMGYAMLAGWVKAGRIAPSRIAVVEPNADLRRRAGDLGVAIHESVETLQAKGARLVMFAVKPQVMRDVVPAYRTFTDAGAAVLSIAAGTPIATFESLLGDVQVVRCMPNTPALIGQGVMALYANARTGAETRAFVENLLSANGMVVDLESEDQMDAVTAVSGSGPAYVFHFIEALTEAGRKAGLSDDIAAKLAMQTVAGAGALAAASEESPGRLREQVTSPNGTTAAALAVLMGEGRLGNLVAEAVIAARDRAVELRD